MVCKVRFINADESEKAMISGRLPHCSGHGYRIWGYCEIRLGSDAADRTRFVQPYERDSFQ